MYDATWARTIVHEFREDRTRTELTDTMLVAQLYSQGKYWADPPRELIYNGLVRALQENSGYWALYKRFYKQKPVAPAKIQELALEIWHAYWRWYDDDKQRRFKVGT